MSLKIVFSGFGGQGVLMMGYVLAVAGMKEDKHVTFLPAYGAEVRGGTANCTVVVSDEEIASPIASSPEFVVAMNYPSMIKYQNMVKSSGTMFLNSDLITEAPAREDIKLVRVPVNTLAHDMGADRSLNMVMLGAVREVTDIVSGKSILTAIETVLAGKKQKLIDMNQKAVSVGADFIRGSK
ncbi:MAG: 2-oxoacid:acceptor oxidoreductase family protein [Deltaproteobacteria bacterium]|nr:2-oxoacid:acceptor oxidoreductase family protein [Deltaproteobacteria bacterium]